MKRGLTLLEVLLTVPLLVLLISGAMSLYEVGSGEMGRAKLLITEAWLAKGKLDTAAESIQLFEETKGRFSFPFQDYSFDVQRKPGGNDPALGVLTVEVDGPKQTRIVLQRLFPAAL